jgi:trimeric autotransporter adhesin
MRDQSCSIEKLASVKQSFQVFQYGKICGLIFLALGILVGPAFATTATVTFVAGISTLAGTGSPGLATSPTQANTAPLLGPVALETDAAGNVYLADGQFNTVWKINRQTGIMTIFAGIPGPSGQTGDGGPAVSAKFRGPEGLRLDQAGNLYIVDTGNFAVRKVDTNGIITTYAGRLHVSGYTGDGGLATSATLGGPSYIALDHAGNLYISDLINNVIRRVDATTHIITTVAGNNTSGFSGDGALATSAQLNSPNGLAFDSKGNLYITDRGNNVIREVAAATGIITTVAGVGGSSGSTGDGGPATSALLNFPWSLTVDSSDNLYIGDFLNGAVRKVDAISQVITTVAGMNGSQGNSGDGGPATLAQMSNPTDVAFDNFGHLYVADLISTTVREVDFQPSFPDTAVGSTSSSQNLILQVTGTLTINSISVPNSQGGNPEYAVGSLAGTGCSIGSPIVGGVNGLPCVLPVTFSPAYPGARRVPLIISANDGSAVTFVDGLTGVGVGAQIGFTPAIITTVAGNGTLGYTGDGGAATSAEFQQPFAVAVDFQGNLFISDFSKDVVRRVDATTHVVTTVTGNGTAGYAGDFGPAASGVLHSPSGLSFDAAGSLYIADSGNDAVRKIDPATGQISTFAGNGVAAYSGDGGLASSASLHTPEDVALNDENSLFISDSANNALRRIDATSFVITSAAGNGSAGSTGNGGLAVNALLSGPDAVAVNTAGDVYIADNANNVIRKISADGKNITAVAGTGVAGFSGDGGPATSAKVNSPQGLAVDSAGNLYIADSANNVFRKVSASTQNVTTLAGDKVGNAAGYTGDSGAATSALLHTPTHPALDAAGNIYFSDSANGVVRKIAGVAPVAFASTNVSSASAAQDVTIANNGTAALVISGLTLPADYNLSGADTTCTASTSLAPAASCVLGIVFAPTATGALNETLTVTDNLGTQIINLSGTGLAVPIVTTTTLTVPSPPLVSGQAVVLTATVAPTPTGSSTGTVSFFDGATLLGTSNVNSSGVATFNAQHLADGAHSITAVYSGNSTSATSTSAAVAITLTAPGPGSPVATTTTLSVPSSPIVSGQAVTLTATVAPAPTGSSKGTVSFFDGTTLLGTSNVNASGIATFTAQGLTDGAHSITAIYSGNSTSATSTSAAVMITFSAAAQFSVTAPAAPIAATPGTPVNVTIGIPPIGTFNSKVTMSASGLPAGATATFNPPVVTPGSNGANTVMTVTFAKNAGTTPLPTDPQPSQPTPLTPFALFAISALGLTAMLAQKLATRFPRPLTAAFTTAALLVASVSVVGCNGGFAGLSPNTPAAQTVVVTVTGTSGSIHHSTTVTIDLQ